jgi:putative ABC transport system ATP-binding protein
MPMPSYIELKNISQSFQINDSKITLFDRLSLSINEGSSYAITGPSGAGKSSLLMLASGLEKPTSGQGVYVKNTQIKQLDDLRTDIGFIFQQFHLLPELTALNNVALPLKLRGDKQANAKAKTWLDKVGLSHRENHKPSELSGGEQQRVAIARALVFNPKFIFADEPTGNLDQKSAIQVADILITCCQENNAGLVMVTHSEALANRAQHIYSLADGQLTYRSNSTLKVASC